MTDCTRTRRLKENKKRKSLLRRILDRELGFPGKLTKADVPFSSAQLPHIWSKRCIDPGFRNKIFASQWITKNNLVYGTKCNQLVLYDTTTDEALEIPLIKCGTRSSNYSASTACGIHSIQKNLSQTLLATGGFNVNEVGVYKLCELSPYCLLKDCHKDWVFDLRWIDDSHLVSCSRDSSVALWKIPDHEDDTQPPYSSSIHVVPGSLSSVPVVTAPVAHAVSSVADDRFRAVEYVTPFSFLAVVSMSRRLYMYDVVRMGFGNKTRPVFTLALRDAYQEAVALRSWPSDPRCIALATHHCVILFDIRCSNPVNASVRCIHPPLSVSGVRSLNFSGDILSYGSSNGQVHFYDLRATKHLPTHLDVGPGWVKPFNCDNADDSSNPFDPIPSATGDNWSAHNFSIYSWHIPQPSTHQSLFLASTSSNSFPIFTRTNFVSHVNNLRVRLDRIQNRLAGLRDRRLAIANASLIYSITGLRVPNVNDVDTDAVSNNTEFTSDSALNDLPPSNPSDLQTARSDEEDSGSVIGPFDDMPVSSHNQPTSNNSGTRPRINLDLPDRGRQSFISIPPVLFADLDPNSTILAHRRLTAIYTHEYDPSGTRLFTAGGPIASTCHGNVAALWE